MDIGLSQEKEKATNKKVRNEIKVSGTDYKHHKLLFTIIWLSLNDLTSPSMITNLHFYINY